MPNMFVCKTTIVVTCKTCAGELEVELKGDNLFISPCENCLTKESVRLLRQFADKTEEKIKGG